jgi:hypothetical protein
MISGLELRHGEDLLSWKFDERTIALSAFPHSRKEIKNSLEILDSGSR